MKSILMILEELPLRVNIPLSILGLIIFTQLGFYYEWEGVCLLGVVLYTISVFAALWFYYNVKILSIGIRRFIIVFGIVLPLLIVGLVDDLSEEWGIISLVLAVAYWILVVVGLWIYKGFLNENPNNGL